ncbi:hypothetical protein FA13DRAFT_4736 [Coprinellus micaceus]|uniref:Uncharacterized protein n=1 Tax=Coprinellus micaceus TaxID=71717 RepID=A0A4Y7TZ82_COPMI|nr:hypothetical protein FA13DRAFT_4736 [Coprinellus micaceus]
MHRGPKVSGDQKSSSGARERQAAGKLMSSRESKVNELSRNSDGGQWWLRRWLCLGQQKMGRIRISIGILERRGFRLRMHRQDGPCVGQAEQGAANATHYEPKSRGLDKAVTSRPTSNRRKGKGLSYACGLEGQRNGDFEHGRGRRTLDMNMHYRRGLSERYFGLISVLMAIHEGV